MKDLSYFSTFLPELYPVLRKYFNEIDYLNLLNCSKQLFKDLKYQTRQLYFSCDDSSKYITDAEFRKYVLTLVANPLNQLTLQSYSNSWDVSLNSLALYLYHCDDNFSRSPVLKEMLNRREKISLSYNQNITHFEGTDTSKIKRLIIRNFEKLSNISRLDSLQELYLYDCEGITDINCFKKLRKLHLEHCDGIRDVSELSHVFDLAIVSCRGIRNISSLTNNFKLHYHGWTSEHLPISKLPKHRLNTNVLHDFEESVKVLQNVTHLTLAHYPDISLFIPRDLTELILHGCNLRSFIDCSHLHRIRIAHALCVTNLEGLATVPVVEIDSLERLKDLSGLGKSNKYVFIQYCNLVEDFSPLANVHRVVIENCSGLTDISQFTKVKQLSISSCSDMRIPENYYPLINKDIRELELLCCHSTQINIEGICNITSLRIERCLKISSLNSIIENTGNKRLSLSGVHYRQLLNAVPDFLNLYLIAKKDEGFSDEATGEDSRELAEWDSFYRPKMIILLRKI